MQTILNIQGQFFSCDLTQPIDISLPITSETGAASAWHCSTPRMEPVVMGSWIGDVNHGAPVNFRNIFFNPHGNGTHTECVGHISKEFVSVNKVLSHFHLPCTVVSVEPRTEKSDRIIYPEDLEPAFAQNFPSEALVIRTLPQENQKRHQQYTDTNPPYLHNSCATFLQSKNIKHLLVDMPSVDKEKDEGKLLMHHAFWNYPSTIDQQRTITELVFVPNEIPDGNYLLNLMVAAFENDAAPSRPVLYSIRKIMQP